MRNSLSPLLLLFIVAGLLACTKKDPQNAFPHTKQYGAEIATTWYKMLTELTRTHPYVPPQTTRIMAYTGVALYESVVPGMPSYQSIYTHLTGSIIPFEKKKDYYWPAAANAALARIASKLVSDYPNPNLPAITHLEDSFFTMFTSLMSAEELQKSISFGRQVADIIYDWSKTDGTLTSAGTPAPCPPYTPLGGPGNWTPTPPGFFPAAGACQGDLRTFVPNVLNALPNLQPIPYSTTPGSAFHTAALATYQNTNNATAADNQVSQSWRDLVGTNLNTPAHMLKLTAQILEKENRNLEDAATILAKEGMAMHDAIVAAFDQKFEFALLRPITYIRDVLSHNSWNTLYPTPQHPAYPAVSTAAAASSVVILEKAFGTAYSFLDSTQKTLYGTYTYSTFNQLLDDVGKSRVLSGLNYQFATDDGITLGRFTGNHIANLPFKK